MSEQAPAGVMEDLLRNMMIPAQTAAINAAGGTGAEMTRAAVRAAVECALGNGLITVVPPEQWPAYVSLDPPYDPEAAWRST
jgi:hypothetical protein